jgi:hypothetical protein
MDKSCTKAATTENCKTHLDFLIESFVSQNSLDFFIRFGTGSSSGYPAILIIIWGTIRYRVVIMVDGYSERGGVKLPNY